MQFDTLFYQWLWVTTPYGGGSKAAQSTRTEKQYVQLRLHFLLYLYCLPWSHLNIKYFTSSLAIETCGELCATVHRQPWADTQCCLKDCSGFTAGEHFDTDLAAWLQWVCVSSWDTMENFKRRCSLLLMSHDCTENHRQTSRMFALHDNSFLRLIT